MQSPVPAPSWPLWCPTPTRRVLAAPVYRCPLPRFARPAAPQVCSKLFSRKPPSPLLSASQPLPWLCSAMVTLKPVSLREGFAWLSSVPAQDRPCLQRKGSSHHPPPPTVVSCPPPCGGALLPSLGLSHVLPLSGGPPISLSQLTRVPGPMAQGRATGASSPRRGPPCPSRFSLVLLCGAGSVGQATWGQAWGAAVRLGPGLVLLLFRALLWAPGGCGPLFPGLWAPTGKGAGVWAGEAAASSSFGADPRGV